MYGIIVNNNNSNNTKRMGDKTHPELPQVIDFFTKKSGNGDDNGGGATVADILEGLSLGYPTMNESRSRAVANAFRKLDEGGSGVVGEGDLRRRYDAAT